MMRVLVVADLHLDLWLAAGRDPVADIAAHHPDVLIIAGDLSNKPKVRWPHMLVHIAQHIDLARVHVMPGNHDYYDHCLDDEDRLAGICKAAGAQFVQKRELRFGAARFLCCTLWTDFALHGDPTTAMTRAETGMNDYRYIRMASRGYGRIRPADTAQAHADHRAWLDARLGDPHDGPTIVVTHHCPHPALVGERPGTMAPAYASDLSGLIVQHQPDFWFFGHTHAAGEIRVGKTVVRNVSLGYPDEEDCGQRLALDAAVHHAAKRDGVPSTYRQTQEFNYKGRMLYDQVATRLPFVIYEENDWGGLTQALAAHSGELKMTTGHMFMAMSLDGFVAREDFGLDWLMKQKTDGEEHGHSAFMDSIDGLVMGSGSFRTIRSFGAWPCKKPVVVLSNTMKPDDIPEELRATVTVGALAPRLLMDSLAEALLHKSCEGFIS